MDKTEFFAGCRTPEEARTRFRQLCMTHHPDKGGDAATFQRIKDEYAAVRDGRAADGGQDPLAETMRGLVTILRANSPQADDAIKKVKQNDIFKLVTEQLPDGLRDAIKTVLK